MVAATLLCSSVNLQLRFLQLPDMNVPARVFGSVQRHVREAYTTARCVAMKQQPRFRMVRSLTIQPQLQQLGRAGSVSRALVFFPGSGATAAATNTEDMQEYRKLKSTILDRTRTSGALFALYLFITVDGQTALCSLIGTWAAFLYLLWLMHDVDSVKPTDTVPLNNANKITTQPLRFFARILAAYLHALRPRLVVPIALAALVTLYNSFSAEPLGLIQEGCLFAGFLAYKAALITLVADANVPKKYDADLPTKPTLSRIEDEFDMYGRPRKSSEAVANDKILENVPENLDKPQVRKALSNLVGDDLIQESSH